MSDGAGEEFCVTKLFFRMSNFCTLRLNVANVLFKRHVLAASDLLRLEDLIIRGIFFL